MKKYKRLMLFFVCMCFAAFSLSACKKSMETEANEAKETHEKETVESEMQEKETAESEKETVPETEGSEESAIQSPSVCGSLSVEGTQLVGEHGEAV